MPNFEKEKTYYNALNIASFSNFNLLGLLKKKYKNWENCWEEKNYFELENAKNLQKETLEKLKQRKKNINPEKCREEILNQKVELLLIEEKGYPFSLKEIPSPPLGIYLKGKIDNNPKIAVVGTRRHSEYGKRGAEKFSSQLSRLGFTIVSGLAEGIDTISHQSTLNEKNKTIAVLGSGFNFIFPPQNKKLAEKISQNGCLISEYPLETMADRHQFPARNRIISGLSLGVLVIEAPQKSGSLITARIALEQNREVFALPGSIFNTKSEGNNELIKQGAKLVSCAKDILEELNLPGFNLDNISLSANAMTDKEKSSLSKEQEIIFEIIKKSPYPADVDCIIGQSDFSISKANEILTILELKNLIKNCKDGYYLTQ